MMGTLIVKGLNNFEFMHFMTLIFAPSKDQKSSGFLMFSEGRKRDQWHEMGYRIFKINKTADLETLSHT